MEVDDVAAFRLQEEPLGHVVFVGAGDRLESGLASVRQSFSSTAVIAFHVGGFHIQFELFPSRTR
jgi:hypothetical protein